MNMVNNKVNDLETKLTYKNSEIENLKREKMDLMNKINELKMNTNIGEKLICIQFNSFDQNVNYSIPCEKTDIFSVIEKKLYAKYPEYKGGNNYHISRNLSLPRL